MPGDRVPRPALDLVQCTLEALVGERLDLAAVLADEMVVVLAAAVHGLEPGDSRPDVDALHEAPFAEQVEHPVDARDADGAGSRRAAASKIS